MTGRAKRNDHVWNDSYVVAVAYAGGQAGAAAIAPACHTLRRALPTRKLVALWPSDLGIPRKIAALLDTHLFYPAPSIGASEAAPATLPIVEALRDEKVDAVIVFTPPEHAPYAPAYLAYLAGVRWRAGISNEFAGGTLSHPVAPPGHRHTAEERHLFLLEAIGVGRVPPMRAPAAYGHEQTSSWSR